MTFLPARSRTKHNALLGWLLCVAMAARLWAGDPPSAEKQITEKAIEAPAERPPAAESAAAALPVAELEAASAALHAADEAFNRALMARDRDAVERHLASDAIFLDDEDARRGKLAFLTLMQPVFEAKHGFTFAGETVMVKAARSGELGYSIDATTITFKQPWEDEPTVSANHTLTVWTRDSGQPWKIRVYSTLIVHTTLGHATEPRTALMIAWPELADRIAAEIQLGWTPESTTRAVSGELAYSFGGYSVGFTQGGKQEAGTGSFVAVWEKGGKGRWQLAAEAYTPPFFQ